MNRKVIIGIYEIRNLVNNNIYIGRTCDFFRRKGEHILKFKIFDVDLDLAKKRVGLRDFKDPEYAINNGYAYNPNKVEYINKQFEDFQNIKKYIQEQHKEVII